MPTGVVSWAEPLEGRLLLSASLLRDLNTAPAPATSAGPGPYYTVGDRILFRANDRVHGTEWWVSDGTEAGTGLLADIFPGPDSSTQRAISLVRSVATLGGELLFTADDGVSGIELWKTDGTPAGTVRVKDISPGAGSSRPDYFSVMGDTLYFGATDLEHGAELWRTDGTEAGTVLVADVYPGRAGSAASPMAPVNGRMAFAAATPALGSELYSTDGTPAGTSLLKDINPGAPSSDPGFQPVAGALPPTWYSDFGVADGVLYFAADDAANGRDLYKSDGTAAGTVLAADVAPDNVLASPRRISVTSGGVYFVADAYPAPTSLYRVTDDPAAPELISRLGQEPSVAVVDDTLYLAGSAGSTGARLFKLDPATGRLAPLVLASPLAAGQPFEPWLVPLGGSLFFLASNGLVKTDGTPAGTEVLRLPSVPKPGIVAAGGALYFSADGRGLWRSDGTDAGTARVRAINTATASSAPGAIHWLGDRGLFAAADPDGTRRVWVTDGTSEGTSLLTGPDFPAGVALPKSPQYGPLTQVGPVVNGRAFFFGETDAAGIELWSSDGTAAGTGMVADINPGAADATYGNAGLEIVPMGGKVFFAADDGVHGRELWTSDGTAGGTVLLRDTADINFVNPSLLTAVGGLLYFFVYESQGVRALWKTDGTPEGTARVKQLANPPFGGGLYPPVAFRGQLFFSIETRDEGKRLWRSDGTPEGTVTVGTPPAPNGWVFGPDELTVAGDKLFFRAGTGPNPLWVTDGTDAGTRPLADLMPGVDVTAAVRLRALGDSVLFFTYYFQSNKAELWTTDGTAAGTAKLKTFTTRSGADADPAMLGVFDGRLYFRVSTAETGNELWATGGTAEGTVLAHDVWPGPGGSTPGSLSVHEGRLYFAGDDGQHGAEPFSAPLPARVVGRHVFYNNSRYDGADAAANSADDAAIAPDKHALLPGDAASAANVTSYARGINGVMIDVMNLPTGAGPSAADFVLDVIDPAGPGGGGLAVVPASVSVRRGAGEGGSDRVTLTFADNTVRNTWLRIRTLAGAATGLAGGDEFSFGNLVGDTGDGDAAPFRVNALDLAAVRRAVNTTSDLAGRFDFNRDGRVNALDLSAVRSNLNRSLDAPPAVPVPSAATIFADGLSKARVWDEREPALLE